MDYKNLRASGFRIAELCRQLNNHFKRYVERIELLVRNMNKEKAMKKEKKMKMERK